jgi:hypothetical protein
VVLRNVLRATRRRYAASICALAILLVISSRGARTDENDVPAVNAGVPPCPLCAETLAVPIVPLGPAAVDSMLRGWDRFNREQLARLDSLFLAGRYGDPKSEEARRAVHRLAQISTVNAYRDLARLGTDTTRVYEASEATLHRAFQDYSDAGLICIARLKRLRFGLGRVCMHYDLSNVKEGRTVQGGKPLRYRVEDVKLDGQMRRVLRIDLPTGTADVVEVLLSEHYTFEVEYVRSAGPPAPYEWFLVHDIQGGWLRKWGTHRPTAFMFWVTPQLPPRTSLPERPLAGVRIYIPNLKWKLPFFIPDIGLDDLRTVELPQPILSMRYLREHRFPGWLEAHAQLGFEDWGGFGPLPPEIRRRFPDR